MVNIAEGAIHMRRVGAIRRFQESHNEQSDQIDRREQRCEAGAAHDRIMSKKTTVILPGLGEVYRRAICSTHRAQTRSRLRIVHCLPPEKQWSSWSRVRSCSSSPPGSGSGSRPTSRRLHTFAAAIRNLRSDQNPQPARGEERHRVRWHARRSGSLIMSCIPAHPICPVPPPVQAHAFVQRRARC
ncbi:hypothetical protein BAUCODRAFT_332567 [Baudoinia panamericana UAMH 10762]|uniref:Uncharacterized protein n=1 Tax=Baudoinia panamericana (strain UAMH 10762) TaxID=717646 RepID=M2MI72_BAUPA|nr:uncharacterized protein BAUCODRAFT_332567 [Baudoinia panamericana UAMH 10762]EMC90968.1 hypothetical protein BAUCODRAFT_332567 [Baudoinia panamericana UAMH 10762]